MSAVCLGRSRVYSAKTIRRNADDRCYDNNNNYNNNYCHRRRRRSSLRAPCDCAVASDVRRFNSTNALDDVLSNDNCYFN